MIRELHSPGPVQVSERVWTELRCIQLQCCLCMCLHNLYNLLCVIYRDTAAVVTLLFNVSCENKTKKEIKIMQKKKKKKLLRIADMNV